MCYYRNLLFFLTVRPVIIFCTPIFGDFLFPKCCLQMDRWRPSSFPSFPQEEWWCSPLLFSLFPLVCANAAWKEEEETARKQQCRKDQHISKWIHKKHWSLFFYQYMTVRMFFILSKTAIELQEQQEVSRSPGVKGALIRQEAALLRSSLFLIFVSAPDTSHFPPRKEISILWPRLLLISKTTTTREAQSSV